MTVYLVVDTADVPIAVFSTLELARAWMKTANGSLGKWIEAWSVDDPTSEPTIMEEE